MDIEEHSNNEAHWFSCIGSGLASVDSLEAVGWEGFWGTTMLALIIVPCSYLPIGKNLAKWTPNNTFENVWDAFAQLRNEPKLVITTVCQIVSVACFNISGIHFVQM